MLRICHIASGDLWAGAEVMAADLLKGLQSFSEVSLLAIVLNEGRLANELRSAGIKVVLLDETQGHFWDIVRSARRIIERFNPHIIHSHRYKENIISYLVGKKEKRAKLVTTQHGMPEPYGAKASPRHAIISRLNILLMAKKFDVVVAVSNDIKKAFVGKFKFKDSKVSIIHNGVQMPSLMDARRDNATFKIGSCGRLFAVKDYGFMISIAKAAVTKSSGLSFLLAGDGPEQERLETRIKMHGLDEGVFELLGHLNDMPSFYRAIDVYLNTSLHEGIPMSILEGMSYGLPVIAPNVGGIPEIIEDGVEGFLVEKRDAVAFAEKCLLLKEDRRLWSRMADAARKKVAREFSMDTMAGQYYRLYAGLCTR